MSQFNPSHKAVMDEVLLQNPLIRTGKMFGFPAYYVGKKLCICLYENGIGIKLPEGSVRRLLETDGHSTPFQPYGKAKMREWVQIDLEVSKEYLNYQALFDEAIQYALDQQEPIKQ